MISFIIPVYKVEKYIYTCIKSIFNLNLKDFEVIIVNDGTPDNSIEQISEFLDNPNLILINQKNSGLSIARNTGLDIAKGKYVWFIDSDDHLIYNNFFVNKLEDLMQENFDIIQLQYNLVYENSDLIKVVSKHFNGLKRGIDLIKEDKLHTAAQFKIYNRDFLIKNKLSFYPNLLHEDVEFSFKVVSLAKKCISIEFPIYNYLQRNTGSIMSSLTIKNVNSIILINDSLISFFQNNIGLLKEIEKKYNDRICINTNMAMKILYKEGIYKNKNALINLLTIDVLNCFKNSTRKKYEIEHYIFIFIKLIIK